MDVPQIGCQHVDQRERILPCHAWRVVLSDGKVPRSTLPPRPCEAALGLATEPSLVPLLLVASTSVALSHHAGSFFGHAGVQPQISTGQHQMQTPWLRERALPFPGGVGREGEQCADHKAQGFLQAFMKYLAFFKNLLGISLSCCLPTQMLSCNCVYRHPSVPSALEVQHCARMPKEETGSIAAIPQLPKTSVPQRKTPCRGYRPALLLS